MSNDFSDEMKTVTLPTVVQGKTMEQWEYESVLNEQREMRGEPHVHPTLSDPPTNEEREAFFHSMTPYESARALAKMGGPLGDVAGALVDAFAVAALIDAFRELFGGDD